MKYRIGLVSAAVLLATTLAGCATSGRANPGLQASAATNANTNTTTPTPRTGRLMVATDRLGGVIYRQPATPMGPATAAVKTD